MRQANLLFSASILPALLIGAGWHFDKQNCGYPVSAGFAPVDWTRNLWQQIKGEELDCDPWDNFSTGPLDGPLAFSFSINAYAGPTRTNFELRPEGEILFYPSGIWEVDGNSSRNYAYRLNDPAIYRLAVERLSSLRDYSHASTIVMFDELRKVEKIPLTCGSGTYHGSYTAHWDGQIDGFDDFSTFEMSLRETCPASRAALARFGAVAEAIIARIPQSKWDEWRALEQQAYAEWREEDNGRLTPGE